MISFLTFNIIAKQLKIAKSNIIHAIVKGVPVENAASSSDDMMPLPYCKAPMSAAAEPTMLEGTASRAAALVHDAIMPFILNITNTKPTIANMPPHPVTADRKKTDTSQNGCDGRAKEQFVEWISGDELAIKQSDGRNSYHIHPEKQPIVSGIDMEISDIYKWRSSYKRIYRHIEKRHTQCVSHIWSVDCKAQVAIQLSHYGIIGALFFW
ncbi:MAG: hypothetical protein L6U16_03420 [Porphyromonadaceae bacterium]|nr:MAG: hypothetical protein L6U16_03420 [Porphyromonadaceae bacterium]